MSEYASAGSTLTRNQPNSGNIPAGAIVPSTPIAPGQGPLIDDLGGRQLPRVPEPPRLAEGAGAGAADLARDAEREPLRRAHADRLDARAVGESEHELVRIAVRALVDRGRLGQFESTDAGQRLAELERRPDQFAKKRMGTIGTTLELRMGLGSHPVRVIDQFDEVDQPSVR